MRLQMFEIMDDTAMLLNRRLDYYESCAYDLQSLIRETLSGEELTGVHVRLKSEKSMREKILRKRLYLAYDNNYDLLSNLSDLVGLRAECRFLREERVLYERLIDACTLRHRDGSYSIPAQPNMRFDFSNPQPEVQENGLPIYRIDGKYHKNGVTTPFELQIKALVHVFWTEVEHQLIYKNHSYLLMDDFMKKLLYTNYESLRQLDGNLQLLFDQIRMQADMAAAGEPFPQHHRMRPILAKTLSDVFLRHMHEQMGFSLRLNHVCDILAQYLLISARDMQDPMQRLTRHMREAAPPDLSFEDALDLGGAYDSDDPFCRAMGCYLSQQLNLDYEWNMFFRMLFAMESGDNLSSFSNFLGYYRARFGEEGLYAALPGEIRPRARACVLAQLADALIERGDISILFEETIAAVEEGIQAFCVGGEVGPEAAKRCLRKALVEESC